MFSLYSLQYIPYRYTYMPGPSYSYFPYVPYQNPAQTYSTEKRPLSISPPPRKSDSTPPQSDSPTSKIESTIIENLQTLAKSLSSLSFSENKPDLIDIQQRCFRFWLSELLLELQSLNYTREAKRLKGEFCEISSLGATSEFLQLSKLRNIDSVNIPKNLYSAIEVYASWKEYVPQYQKFTLESLYIEEMTHLRYSNDLWKGSISKNGALYILYSHKTLQRIQLSISSKLNIDLPEISLFPYTAASVLDVTTPKSISLNIDEFQRRWKIYHTRIKKIAHAKTRLHYLRELIHNRSRGKPCPIFITLDIETWERDHDYLTEVGWTILKVGDDRALRVQSKHYVVEENVSKRNGRYVADNRYNFQFGETVTAPLLKLKRALNEDINYRPRDAIWIFHGAKGDIGDLIKFELVENVFRVYGGGYGNDRLAVVEDTNVLYLGHSPENMPNPQMKLKGICENLGVEYHKNWLHNAGLLC
ncbi:hypothetical protein HK098_000041 [Nowakowskiella sp. JEL0407]|nr:hypothetical protein HK098_000041 [Nowakowskiella sp. JEL0407]